MSRENFMVDLGKVSIDSEELTFALIGSVYRRMCGKARKRLLDYICAIDKESEGREEFPAEDFISKLKRVKE